MWPFLCKALTWTRRGTDVTCTDVDDSALIMSSRNAAAFVADATRRKTLWEFLSLHWSVLHYRIACCSGTGFAHSCEVRKFDRIPLQLLHGQRSLEGSRHICVNFPKFFRSGHADMFPCMSGVVPPYDIVVMAASPQVWANRKKRCWCQLQFQDNMGQQVGLCISCWQGELRKNLAVYAVLFRELSRPGTRIFLEDTCFFLTAIAKTKRRRKRQRFEIEGPGPPGRRRLFDATRSAGFTRVCRSTLLALKMATCCSCFTSFSLFQRLRKACIWWIFSIHWRGVCGHCHEGEYIRLLLNEEKMRWGRKVSFVRLLLQFFGVALRKARFFYSLRSLVCQQRKLFKIAQLIVAIVSPKLPNTATNKCLT